MSDLRIATVQSAATDVATPMLAFQLFERDRDLRDGLAAVDQRLGGLISDVLNRGDFVGKRDEALVLYTRGAIAAERVLLVGAGKREDFTLERLRRGVGTAVRQAEKLSLRAVAFSMDHVDNLSEHMGAALAARAATEAAVMACWDMREFKSKP